MMNATAYEELPDEIKERLPKDVRDAFHAINDQLQTLVSAYDRDRLIKHQELESLKKLVELYAQRQNQLEEMLQEHIKSCNVHRAENKQVLETVMAIKQGMRITNILRDGILWVGGLVTTFYSLWAIFKEFFK